MKNESILPFYVWILHTDDEAFRHIPEVTRLDATDGSSNEFHDDGLYSTRIFGRVGSDARDAQYGRINLKVDILHPALYERLGQLKGLYKEILNGTAMASWDEDESDFVRDRGPDGQTGYAFFMKYLLKIKFKRNSSKARMERIKFIEDRIGRARLKNLPVIPAGLRDMEMSEDGRPVKSEINDFYFRILSMSRSIVTSRDMESEVYDQVRKSLTNAVYDLYKYFEGLIGGGNGFIEDKLISRRIHEGTRGVLTSMNTGGSYLGSPNTPKFDSTVVGLFQGAVSLAPLVVGHLRRSFLSKVVDADEGSVPLVNPKTLKREFIQLRPETRSRYSTEDGIREVIHGLSNVPSRHDPVTLDGYYLALVYQDDTSFRVFDDIGDLPKTLDKKNVYPLSLVEMIYLSMYAIWGTRFNTVTRYPNNSEDSIYPSRMYVKTTSTGKMLRELGYDWEPLEGDKFLAVEYPDRNISTFHDSMSPHPTRLAGLAADFDGDMGNMNGIQSDEGTVQVDRYLKTREAWIRQDGSFRTPLDYDTVDLILRNLTGRFEHVKNVKKGTLHTTV